MDYFVSYHYVDKKGVGGFGRARITRSDPISSMDAVKEIEMSIYKGMGSPEEIVSMVLLSWQYFEEPKAK